MPKSDKKRSRVHGLGPTPTGPAGGKGQHFLKNMAVVSKIVEKAKLKSTDVALEIGVGTGIMTVRILEEVKRLVAVELDPRMIAETLKQVQGTKYQHRLQFIHGDCIKVDLPYFDVCVTGNQEVVNYMEKNNFKTRLLSRSEGVGYSGTEIRSISNHKKV